MNKYLEKIAGMEFVNLASKGKGARLGKVAKPPGAVSPGSKLVHGDKTLMNAALHKAAEAQQTTVKHDLMNTASLVGLGSAANHATNKAMSKLPKYFGEGTKFHNLKALAVGGTAGAIADYAGIKLNKAINNNVQ